MQEIIKNVEKFWHKNEGCTDVFIANTEKLLRNRLPKNYKKFLHWSNGGEGKIGRNYISLWKVEDLQVLNSDYDIQNYLGAHILAFGTDGGDLCYAFDFAQNGVIIKCGLGDLDSEEITVIDKNFEFFLEKAFIELL